MKTLENQLVFKEGLTRNGAIFTKKALKEAVKKAKGGVFPLSENYNRKTVLGNVRNLKFDSETGSVFADIHLLDSYKTLELSDKVFRLAVFCERIPQKDDKYKLKDIEVDSCGMIEKTKDGLIFDDTV